MGKHDKEAKELVSEVLAHGWVEVTKKGYRKFRCPCGGHMKTIHHSPSDPNYYRNTLMWFRRQECWRGGDTR